METTIKHEGTRVLISLGGNIDEQGAAKLKDFFTSLAVKGVDEVCVNLQDVSYIGSSGIGKILLFYKNLGVQDIKLKLTGVPAHIYELFLELKLDTIFTIAKL